jgi:hypothetical protein
MSPLVGHSPTQTQIASLSGVSRREVRGLLKNEGAFSKRKIEPTSKLEKLIEGWCSDPLFCSRKGFPRALQLRGPDSEFDALVRKYGRDITKKTLKVHLVMLGLAKDEGGRLRLLRERPTGDRYAAATADLRFVASQLASIDFELGHRQYLSKRITLAAQERKSAEAMRQIAMSRLGTVLDSLQSIAADSKNHKRKRQAKSHRLLVSTTIAIESGGK